MLKRMLKMLKISSVYTLKGGVYSAIFVRSKKGQN